MQSKDPYQITEATILEAPTTFKERIKHLGPSLILSAAIVGSGELIATTTLGARAGFTAFWVIILGCLIMVFVFYPYQFPLTASNEAFVLVGKKDISFR